jgi:hypothetical protein
VGDEARPGEPRAVATLPSEAASAEASSVGAPVRDPRDGRRSTAAAIRAGDRNPEPVPHPGHAAVAPDTAPRRVRERAPEVRERAPEVREPDAAAHAARPVRPEPPRVDAPAPGISTAELGRLYDAVKAEIEQLPPEASRQDLLGQLAMINILRVMRESQPSWDDAAAQLWKLRQRMRDRKAGR